MRKEFHKKNKLEQEEKERRIWYKIELRTKLHRTEEEREKKS
jgi:hypothetical protein